MIQFFTILNMYNMLCSLIKNFAGQIQGIGILQLNETQLIKDIDNAKNYNFYVGMIFIIIIVFVVLTIVNKIVTNPIKFIDVTIRRIASKDISFNINKKRDDEIGNLYISINEINNNFRQIIKNIINTTFYVLDTSKYLKTASFKISERAGEQAASTEEIATSMEQMVATIIPIPKMQKNG